MAASVHHQADTDAVTDIDRQELARLCFRRVPDDVNDDDVVLAALWHLHRRAVLAGLGMDSAFRCGHLGRASGLRATNFRAALERLATRRLVGRLASRRVFLMPAGYARCHELLDIEQAMRSAA